MALPIDAILPDVREVLRAGRALVLEAPPGAGKTTRVPPALLDLVEGEVVVLEPRRLAARLAARRVAEEMGVEVGGLVGYQVRFEEVAGPKTRLRYVTEGLLARRLVAAPSLPGVGAVVLDEFHERHLHGDLALALLKRLVASARPELRLVVMSATLEAAPVAAYLGGCPVLRAEGRVFPVALEHAERADDRPLEKQVASAVRRLVTEEADGDVLVFLPGAAEIARARDACAELAARHDLDVVPLHGDLPPAEQDRAVLPASRRKVILATNVAETSVTIEGIVAVVDSGLARVPGHSPWSGVPSLRVQRISRASATQRAGRAGRTRPGRCLRLYTQHDHDTRPAHEPPEIRRLDLAETVLSLHAAGVARPGDVAWLDAPPEVAMSAAETLLVRLGAVDARGALTETGRRMLRFPVHPRVARMLVEAEARGVAREAAAVSALLGERDLTREARAQVSGPSDVLWALDLARGRRHGLIERAVRQLERLVDRKRSSPAADPDTALRLCLLAGFPDRVARRRRSGSRELVLSAGGAAEQAAESVVRDAPLVVVVDAEERQKTIARMVSAIEPEWLLDLFPEALSDTTEVTWNAEARRVEVVSRLRYDHLVLEERRRPPAPAEADEAARVLAEAAGAAGLDALVDRDALAAVRGRLAFAAELAGAPAPDEPAALRAACAGCTSFAEIDAQAILAALRASVPHLDRLAPERLTLPSGRTTRVHYDPGKPPWIASRLQDFFGLKETPRVGGGRVPVVVHLLAPNQRPVQVTTDLANFWKTLYPELRKQLMRRYPKHAWPEKP